MLIAVVLVSLYVPALADKPPVVQYVNIAPLPGAGIALDSMGKVDGQGAMQINIPVAYTPGSNYMALAAYAGEYIRSVSEEEWNNGSGFFAMGFGGRPRVYVSAMAVSRILKDDSKVLSGQLQLLEEKLHTPAFAIGVQDLLDKETKDYGNDFATGRAWYAVATKGFSTAGHNIYATLGWGKARFLDNFFFGLSTPLNDYFTLSAEYDGYQFNEAIGWRPTGRYSDFTLLAGYNHEAGPLVGAQVAGKGSSLWAIPAMILLIR
jgi:hypothetical protein